MFSSGALEGDTDGQVENHIVRAKLHVDFYGTGPFASRLWMHESEPGTTLVAGTGLDVCEEDVLEGVTAIDQYEAMPVSKLVNSRCIGSNLWVTSHNLDLLPFWKKWKKQQVPDEAAKSNLNLCAITHQGQSLTTSCFYMIDIMLKHYWGAQRLKVLKNIRPG